MEETSLPLHVTHAHGRRDKINRIHSFLHALAVSAIIYYRSSSLFQNADGLLPIFPWLLISSAELLLSFIWLLDQATYWRTITRTVYPERLPDDEHLPPIDVFICTADSSKEPVVDVMNTVISAMALDYPANKLNVYLSDDGGAPATLSALKEAWSFALWWIPFVRKYGIRNRCPSAYFGKEEDRGAEEEDRCHEFVEDRKRIKEKYEAFENRLLRASEGEDGRGNAKDHPSVVQVISSDTVDDDLLTQGQLRAAEMENEMMPLLVYVAREKTSSRPHHFKAGALNVLLRISGVISNSPYILAMDCDMYSNDSMSARQAMCFHLDPKLSPSLAFLQFPQRFHNSNSTNLYDNLMRVGFKIAWNGPDGIGGPVLSGTGFYMRRKALYGDVLMEGVDINDLRSRFGTSNEFIKSVHHQQYDRHRAVRSHERPPYTFLQDIKFLASAAYEDNTKWGHEAGFMYHCVVEDVITGFLLHCKGWISVFHDPPSPQFLGSFPTNLNDALIQYMRWTAGLEEITLSKYCPLIYGPLQGMSLLQTMCYSYITLFPLHTLPVWCLATIPQLCLLHGIPLYPRLQSPFFALFALVFVSSLSRNLYEALSSGGNITSWINEQRMWMLKSLVPYLYGSIEALMKLIGVRQTTFVPTNKVVDEEQAEMFRLGIYDFRTSNMILVPIVTAVIINMVGLVGGIVRTGFGAMNIWEEVFGQLVLSAFILVMSYPVIEGMLLRKDSGRVPFSVTLIAAAFAFGFFAMGSLFLI